jgi:hypothetical protein
MRTALAPTPTFTDAAGNNEKAPALIAWPHQARGTVVNSLKPTGVSVEALAPVTSPTQSGLSDAPKLASSLSLGPLINASNGADNEHNVSTKADSDYRGSH